MGAWSVVGGWMLCGMLASSSLLVGCSSGSTPPDLVGHWMSVHTASAIGFTFNKDGTFASHFIQFPVLPTNPLWDQEVVGTYQAWDTQLTLTPQQSTCGDPIPVGQQPYKVTPDELDLTSEHVTLVMHPDTTPPTESGAMLGCMRSEDSFTAATLVPISN